MAPPDSDQSAIGITGANGADRYELVAANRTRQPTTDDGGIICSPTYR